MRIWIEDQSALAVHAPSPPKQAVRVAAGVPGKPGPQGEQGPQGDQGPEGPEGPQGEQGPEPPPGGQTHIGSFIITQTGDIVLDDMPFAPTSIQFRAALPVEVRVQSTAGEKKAGTESNFAGTMFGFARKSDGAQEAVISGGSGGSINAIRYGSDNASCIYAEYADDNGSLLATVAGEVSSWASDGVTITIGTYTLDSSVVSGLVVHYTAHR